MYREGLVIRSLFIGAGALSLAATPVLASDDLMVFPKEGQSQEQQKKDEYDCYQWAKERTGFDPANPPQVQTAQTQQTQQQTNAEGSAVKGAARGAAGGAVVGAIAGDAGKGAAIGATTGAVVGGARRRGAQREAAAQQQQAQQAQQQEMQRQQAEIEKEMGDYNRAYGACLEGKDYTVK